MPELPDKRPTLRARAIPRRSVLATGAAFLLAGCGEGSVMSSAASGLRIAVMGLPDPAIERAAIAKLPYATMTAKFGRGARGLMVLGRYDGRDRHWISGDRVVIVTRGGRVVKTAGLPENLKQTLAERPDPVDKTLHRLGGAERFVRRIDLDVGRRYGIPVESTFEPIGSRKIAIVEIDFDTLLVRERNVAKTINWRFENLYWVDAVDGFVWKSRQHIARSFPPVDLEILKPAA